MNAFSNKRSCALIAMLAICILAGMPATAAPPKVESFDLTTWKRLQKESPRPSAIVFTATYCANCPAVLAKLDAALKQQSKKGDVVAVVIDEADAKELLASEHYEHATRLFLFAGNEAALRYHVDPRWRGVTPYTALLGANGNITFAAGVPSEEQIEGWLKKSR